MHYVLAPNGWGNAEGRNYATRKLDNGDGTGQGNGYTTGYGYGDGVDDDIRFTFVHLCVLLAITTEVPP